MPKSDFFEKAESDLEAAEEKQKEQDAAEWWNFEGKGGEDAAPKFKGTFEEATYIQKEGDNGPYTCILAYLRDEEGTLYKAWFSAGAAVRGFGEAAPAKGSLILIKYGGKVESNRNAGRKFKDYSIVADEQDFALWDSLKNEFYSRTTTSQGAVQQAQPLAAGEAPF